MPFFIEKSIVLCYKYGVVNLWGVMKVTQILFVLTAVVTVVIWILPFRHGLPGFFTSVELLVTLSIAWQVRDAFMPWWDGNRFSLWAASAARRLVDATLGGEYDKEYGKA
mgnify:CR=1 FL=1